MKQEKQTEETIRKMKQEKQIDIKEVKEGFWGFHWNYFVAFIAGVLIETGIAVFVHDRFVRPYLGDVLVVLVLYCLARSVLRREHPLLPVIIFCFAAVVEILQAFPLLQMLHLEQNRILRILLGSVFDWKDLVCYAVGMVFLFVYQGTEKVYKRNRTL